jgi:hypothetical protein
MIVKSTFISVIKIVMVGFGNNEKKEKIHLDSTKGLSL